MIGRTNVVPVQNGNTNVDINGQELITGVAKETINKLDLVYIDEIDEFSSNSYLSSSNSVSCGAFSPDDNYLFLGGNEFRFYKRIDDAFTLLQTPIYGITPNASCSFSPDGVYLAVCSSSYVYVYKHTGDTLTQIATLAAGASATDVLFSPDGTHLVVVSSAGIKFFKRVDDTFTLLSTPSTTTRRTPTSITFSPDGTYFAYVSSISKAIGWEYLFIYKRSGDEYTQLATPSTTIINNPINVVRYTPDNKYLIFFQGNVGYTFKRTGDTISLFQKIYLNGSTIDEAVRFNFDGNILIVGCDASPYIRTYEYINELFIEKSMVNSPPATSINIAVFSRTNNDYLIMAISAYPTPYLSTFKSQNIKRVYKANNEMNKVRYADSIGYAKQNAVQDSNIQVSRFLN